MQIAIIALLAFIKLALIKLALIKLTLIKLAEVLNQVNYSSLYIKIIKIN